MEQFDVLKEFFRRKNDLAVAAEEPFTITHAGNRITVEYVDPEYIEFNAKDGTPSDIFKIDHLPGRSATFSSVTTAKSFADASLLADHIANVLKSLSEESTTA